MASTPPSVVALPSSATTTGTATTATSNPNQELKGAETCTKVDSGGLVFLRKNSRTGKVEILLIKRHQRPTFKLSKSKVNTHTHETPLQAAIRSARKELGLAPACVSLFGLNDLKNLRPLSPQRYIYRSPHTRKRLHKTVHYFAFYMKRQVQRVMDERDMFPSKLRDWKTVEMRWLDRSQLEQAIKAGKVCFSW